LFADVKPDQQFADFEEQGGHEGAKPYIPPTHLRVGQKLEHQRKQ
jgi:hypothetical protein